MKPPLKTKHEITEADIEAIKDMKYKCCRLGFKEIAKSLCIQKTVVKGLLVTINKQRDDQILAKKEEVNADFMSGLSKSDISRKYKISYANVIRLLKVDAPVKEINGLYFDYSHMGMPFSFG